MAELCSVEDCGGPVRARGICHTHYQRWWRSGHATERICGCGVKLEWKNGPPTCVACQKLKEQLASRKSFLRRTYGITAVQYEAMLEAQTWRCFICRSESPGHRNHFCVDHDHVTGRVRGLLCQTCNRMLGHAADDPERLRTAAAYIESHKELRP